MNEELKRIFGESIAVGDASIPFAHLKYKGDSKVFVVWTITGETPRFCASDEVLYSAVSADIDIYSDSNYLAVESTIKALMKNNEWIWVEDSPEMYEEDTGLYHKCISFEKERAI